MIKRSNGVNFSDLLNVKEEYEAVPKLLSIMLDLRNNME